MTADDRLLDSTAVMARYGYKSRSKFWLFVRKKAVPHVRFNARKIMFDPEALAAWEAKRTVGKISSR
jgi:predicted DNA-binding transcriptional regulator AlpA